MNSTDKEYLKLLEKILTKGKEKGDRTGTGTISVFSHTLEMDMSEGFPLLTTKKMFTKGIIHELLWFLKGDTNIEYLVKNGVNIWTPDAYKKYKIWADDLSKTHLYLPYTKEQFVDRIKTDDEFAKKWGDLGPVYGKQWVNWGKGKSEAAGWEHGAPNYYRHEPLNQILNAIDTLNNNPDSRRIMVSAWNVSDLDNMTLPPCHWAFELYSEELTHEERVKIYIDEYAPGISKPAGFEEAKLETRNIPTRRLSLKWHQRSVDTFLGLPFNIASYGLLLHMFAQQTNMVPGKLVGDLTNVHIYKNHIEQCEEQLSREPNKLPQLALCNAKDIFSYGFDDFLIKDYEPHPTIKGKISV